MRVALIRWSGPLGFVAVAAVGLLLVKWAPYAGRLVESDVRFGNSLLLAPPVEFAFRYFEGVWTAMVLGLLLAASVETLIPRDWLRTVLGRATARAAALGGIAALPAMMCSCCAAPVAVGMRRSGASIGAAMAFWIGSPTLNPAVLAFLALALPWQYAALRLVAGLVLVFGLCALLNALFPAVPAAPLAAVGEVPPSLTRWVRALGRYAALLLPEYLVVVLAVGVLRATILPSVPEGVANDPLALGIAAGLGTLFVIPTAGEIPIAQALLALGVGPGPVAALLVTLPAVSLPSLLMMRRAVPVRALLVASASVALTGAAAGLAAIALAL